MFLPLRALIIEDSEDDLFLVLRELRRGGFEPEYLQVEAAETMAQALEEQDWDIILSDYSLPSFSAPAALKLLKNSSAQIPFIVISGNVGEEIAVQLMQYGCNDYINKGNLTRLCPAIQRELEESKTKKLHKASEALTERLWSILDNSQSEIYFIDAKTFQFKIVSQGALRNLGYTAEEIIEKTAYDIKPEISHDDFYRLVQPLYDNSLKHINFEATHRRKNGTTYPVEVRIQLSNTDEDSILYAIVIDITERLKANKEIETLAKFPQENPSPVIRLDKDLQLIYANPASQDIITYWTNNTSIRAPESWKGLVNECLRKNKVHELEESVGSEIYHWLLSPSSESVFVNCYARNITKQREAEQGLRHAGQVFDNSIEAIMMTDKNNKITRVNPAFHFITGYSDSEILGKSPSILQSGKHKEPFFNDMWLSLKKDKRWQGEIWNRRSNGEFYPAYMTISAVEDEFNNITDYIAIFADISERKRAQEHIHHLAYYDSLTNLPNRLHMQEKLYEFIDDADTNNTNVSVLYVDLDRFKNINESLGHRVADEALTAIANRILDSLPENAILGRMGGDEFLIVIQDTKISNENEPIIQAVKYAISIPLTINTQELYLSASIGVSHYPDDATSMENLIKYAEKAVNQAKFIGNSFQLYTDDLDIHDVDRISMEGDLRKAIEREEFLLHYQPQIDLENKEIIGLEALLRWQHPKNGLISPADFIPLLEQTGLIKEVGDWVLRKACNQSMEWQKLGIKVPRIAVNLSAKQFSQKNLCTIIKNIIQETGINPKLVELEVTESTIMHQMDQVISILRELHDSNIHISIDDFGTGYSSLSYLKHFPIDVLKIDQSFVREIPNDKEDIAIINTIISMGHNLNLSVIAEGVETLEQSQCLSNMGCEWAQGFYFSRPLAAEQCLEYLKSHTMAKSVDASL